MSRAMGRADAIMPSPTPAGTAVLQASGIRVSVDGARLLDDVSMIAVTGEVHALIGPNGAGKSTLLAVLAGDQATAAGTVEVDGRPLGDWRLKELARRRAVMPQQTGVFFPFTVRHVVEMGRAPWLGTPLDRDDDRAVAEAIAVADLVELADRQVPSLSGGERARSAFARVSAQRTGILLLDEPTAALDIHHQERVLSALRERARAGDAVVVVLHDLSLAAAFADRVTLLGNGRVIATGTSAEVLTATRLSEVYRHRIDVFEHPVDGSLIILPYRGEGATEQAARAVHAPRIRPLALDESHASDERDIR